MNIVYCVSENWMNYIPIQIHALRRHNPGYLYIYIISKNFTNADRTMLLDLSIHLGDTKVFLLNCNDQFAKVNGRFTEYTMFRLMIPKLLPLAHKCLYLDADTLVVSDITEMYNKAIPIVAGVIDKGYNNIKKREIGLLPSHNYINAGVILMNLEAIRSRKIDESWERLSKIPHPCNDQDVINLTHENEVVVLDKIYNSSKSTGITAKPKIVHYAGNKGLHWVHKLPQANFWVEATQYYYKNKQ